jgi:lactate dehydrogenase-like 2-hydroxyacid dehydrogenase
MMGADVTGKTLGILGMGRIGAAVARRGHFGFGMPVVFYNLLINSARGDITDQKALIKALRSGTIAGAGLDVYENEPEVPQELIELDNAVVLPHLGSTTLETRTAMGMLENLQDFLDGRQPTCRVA